jgi:hypothetical protein
MAEETVLANIDKARLRLALQSHIKSLEDKKEGVGNDFALFIDTEIKPYRDLYTRLEPGLFR